LRQARNRAVAWGCSTPIGEAWRPEPASPHAGPISVFRLDFSARPNFIGSAALPAVLDWVITLSARLLD